jgi:hypothetical protein
VALWAVGSVLLSGGGPGGIPTGRLWLLAGLLALIAWDRRPRSVALLVGMGALLFTMQRPRQDRDWSEDQTRPPRLTWHDAHRFTVHDLRTFRYRAVDDWDATWIDADYDLRDVVGADMAVERFSSLEAVAHTFLRFRFADGRDLVASVEIRKEKGESFSPVRGLYRQYESMIVLGDSDDVLSLRVDHRQHPVVLHPLQLEPETVAAYLRVILDDVDRLARRPAWYHTLTGSCSSTLALQLRRHAGLPLDWRMFVPGHADALAHDLGWLGKGDLEQLREAHLVR